MSERTSRLLLLTCFGYQTNPSSACPSSCHQSLSLLDIGVGYPRGNQLARAEIREERFIALYQRFVVALAALPIVVSCQAKGRRAMSSNMGPNPSSRRDPPRIHPRVLLMTLMVIVAVGAGVAAAMSPAVAVGIAASTAIFPVLWMIARP